MQRELIIFVPGFGAVRELYLEKLADGIKKFFGKREECLIFRNNTLNRGSGFRSLYITDTNRSQRRIDIYEVEWTDLMPKFSDKPVLIRLWSMLKVLIYWASPNRLRRIFLSPERPSRSRLKFLLMMLGYSLFLLLLWILLTLQEVWSPVELIGDKTLSTGIAVILTLLPFGLVPAGIFDSSHASRCYLQGDIDAQGIRTRLAEALTDLPRHDQEVTVLAHSAGVVVATEVLSEWNSEKFSSVRFITLGSPLSLWAAAEPRFGQVRKQLIENDAIIRWTDFSTGRDWICTGSYPDGKSSDSKYEAPKMPLENKVTFLESASLQSHDLYFDDVQVIKNLLKMDSDVESAPLARCIRAIDARVDRQA